LNLELKTFSDTSFTFKGKAADLPQKAQVYCRAGGASDELLNSQLPLFGYLFSVPSFQLPLYRIVSLPV